MQGLTMVWKEEGGEGEREGGRKSDGESEGEMERGRDGEGGRERTYRALVNCYRR